MMKHVSGKLERRILDSASVFFYREQNSQIEILLAKRKPNLRAFPGLWSGIGGKVSSADKNFVGLEPSALTLDALKACAFREVLEEIGLVLIRPQLKQVPPAEEITLQSLEYSREEYDWSGLLPAGFKQTPEFTIVNPIFKTQYFLYKLNNGITFKFPEDHKEFDEWAWKKPQEWIDGFENQQIRIPPPVLSLLRTFIPDKTAQEAAILSELRNTKPIGLQTPIEIHPGVYVIPLKSKTILPATTTNCFIIGDSEHRYIIDPGSHLEEEHKRLNQVIAELTGKNSLQGILLTHHHRDHWQGIPALINEYNIPIMAHQKTKALLEDATSEFNVDTILKDGQVLDLGFDGKERPWKLEVLFTGGHSQDHVVYLDQRFDALLAGDLVAGVGTVLVENMSEYLTSLDRLIEKKIGMVLPGHGTVHYEGEKLLRRYEEHRLQRLNLILEAFTKHENVATVDELTEHAYSDVDKEYHDVAKMQVQTYLKYLEEKKEVVKEENKFKKID